MKLTINGEVLEFEDGMNALDVADKLGKDVKKAAVAAKAIPNCNICFIDGADMQSALAAFYEVMYSVAPDSIGGSIPGDDFYCVLG